MKGTFLSRENCIYAPSPPFLEDIKLIIRMLASKRLPFHHHSITILSPFHHHSTAIFGVILHKTSGDVSGTLPITGNRQPLRFHTAHVTYPTFSHLFHVKSGKLSRAVGKLFPCGRKSEDDRTIWLDRPHDFTFQPMAGRMAHAVTLNATSGFLQMSIRQVEGGRLSRRGPKTGVLWR